MRRAEALRRVAAFVLVALVAGVGVAGALTLTGGAGAFASAPMSVGAHGNLSLVANQPAETGSVTMSADTGGKVVVVDAAHGNDVDELQLRPVVNALARNGHTVRFYEPSRPSGRALNRTLRSADAFVSVAPTTRFTAAEARGLAAFTDAGGRVLVLAEPEGGAAASVLERQGGASAELAPVLSQYGLHAGSGYLYDLTEHVNNHADIPVTPTGSGPLTEGVDRVVVHEATPVAGPTVRLQTRASAELSSTRDAGRYGVLARAGNVTVVGDGSIVSREWVAVADNEVLVGNLLDFLVTGDRRPMPARSGSGRQPPRP